MKIFQRILLSASALVMSLTVSAQFLSVDKDSYNYNIIPSTKPITETLFTFLNRGSEPITITDIQTSSPDITCHISRNVLETNCRAMLEVTFNPENHKSIFTEYIIVYTTDVSLPQITLKLMGTVKDFPAETFDKFPVVLDIARYSKTNIDFGKITYPNVATDTIEVFNPQDTAITLTFPMLSEYLTVQMFPETIQPSSTALLVVSYNPVVSKSWGQIYDRLYVGYSGRKNNYKLRISLSGNIVEDFSKLTKKQMKNAPAITFTEHEFKFDTVKRGTEVECEFRFQNVGKSQLEIRKIKTSCGCTAGSMEKMSYAKGEKGVVKVTLNTRNKYGHVRQSITIYSNDPNKPETVLFIDGYVID